MLTDPAAGAVVSGLKGEVAHWTPESSAHEVAARLCMANILANPQERLFFKDRDSRFILVSAGWLAAVGGGRTLDEVLGKTDFDMVAPELAAVAFADEQRIIATGQPMPVRVEHDWLPDCPNRWLATSKQPLYDECGNIVGTWGSARDVTAQVEAQQTLTRWSLHDPLTALANRAVLMDRLSGALTSCVYHPGQVALVLIDLDHFGEIDDLLGRDISDQVLVEVANRLNRLAGRGDTVARLGSDEFVVLCTGALESKDLAHAGERVVRALQTPFNVDGQTCTVTASVGCSATTDPHTPPDELLRQADAAMREAKNAGRNRRQVYDTQAHAAERSPSDWPAICAALSRTPGCSSPTSRFSV